MILKETILSAFTERGTLLKWLKKVEAALKDAVLTDVSVETLSDTEIKLKFTFEDGNFIESPVLTLPRGPQGETGEKGDAATITVGTVTTGDAGTDAAVENVGTEQDSILNFTIPRGDTGQGLRDVLNMEVNYAETSASSVDAGVLVRNYTAFRYGDDDSVFIPSSIVLPIKGSESIVIDVSEDGTYIDIHLDANIMSKIERALLLPVTAPASTSLVAVGANNEQSMLTIGDGLSVSDGVISASGGGGSVSLYEHILGIGFMLDISGESAIMFFRNSVLTNSADVIRTLTFEQCMYYFGNKGTPVNGYFTPDTTVATYYPIDHITLTTPNNIDIIYYEPITNDVGEFDAFYTASKEGTITNIVVSSDNVRQII